MSRSIPAEAITAALYAEYFAPVGLNVAGMSSHWRTYAPKSTVRVDESGVPVDATGVGFGDMNARRTGTALFTALAAVLHAARHPARRRLPAAIRQTRQTSRLARLVFNQDALRQALTVALLQEHLEREDLQRIVMIGDGYGVLGATLAAWRPNAQIVFVDLGRSLLFQAMTGGRVFPEATHALVGREDPQAVAASRFVYWPADRLDQWQPGPIDLAVNIASMQEMSAATIASYFDLLRRAPTTWFYCCNRDRKMMPGGEVAEFARYPWTPDDRHVVDGPCPWHQWYVAPAKGRTLPISLLAPYDGPHSHRFTRLAPSRDAEARTANREERSPKSVTGH